MKLAVSAFAAALALASQVARVAGAVVYWQNHIESGDFVIPSGDMLVLRGSNSVDGLLLVSAGAQLVVDPAFDSYLRVGSIDVSGGTFRVGARDKPYAKKAVFELACDSPFPAADIRRKAVVVRENSTLALFGAKGVQQSWTRLRETAQAGESCLALDLPSGWEVGDEIVIPSTDFDPHQAEKRTIVGITPSCVQIDQPLRFMHYGRVTEGVDERAEVGLLTRNIAFRACQEQGDGTVTDASPEVGGHMIFLENFRTVQVEGVELHNFGQGDQLGRYPLHFHLCGQVPRDTFLRGNAIHDTNFRAVAIHGTQGVTLERNVAFNITGHAFMLEDGAETGNVIRENLVALVTEKLTHVRLGSDSQVALSAFYITNPDNTITDNVVAGVEGAGFWLDTRLEVKGLSFLTGKYAGVHPFKVALGDMRRNAVHSVEVGFKFDSPDLDMLDYPQQIYSPPYMYTPAEMPVVSEFRVHHSRQGGWFRSYRIVLDRWVVGDVTEGIQILSRGDTSTEPVETYVTNSLFVGSTANRGNLVASRWQFVNYLENRSDSAVERADDARMAIKLYDGPMYISNSTFRLWYSQPCLNVTNPAIGVRAFNAFLMSTAIVTNDVVFEQTDVKFFVSDREADGGRSTSMVDKLGAISGRAGSTLLPDWDLYMAPNCARSAAFGLACPQRYVNLDVINVDTTVDPTYYGKMRLYRNNAESATTKPPSLAFSGQYIPASSGWLYHPIVSPGASYSLQFERRTPAQLRLRFSYTTAGDVMRLAIAYPAGSVVNSVVDQDGRALRQAASLGDASASVNCFYFDAAKGLLAITVQERAGPDAPSASCAPQGCLTVEIKASVAGISSLGVSDAQMGAILPLVAVTDDRSDWRRQNFPFESAGFDRSTNMDWCKVRDPCLDAIDEGNAKMGVLAYSESPCVGVGCFSNTCRYCKLSFSAAKVPFPGCPYDPNYVAPAPSAAGVCAAFASVGNSAVGVEVIQDTTCANGGGVTGQGCINDACRFCKTRDTTQSANYLTCSSFTSTVAVASSSPSSSPPPSTSVAASAPLTVSTTGVCSQYASIGNSAAGVEVIQDASCVNGGGVNGRGCINDACRYCKTRDTTQSANFLSCSSLTSFTGTATTKASATAATSAPATAQVPASSVVPSTCQRLVAQGDVDAGISAQPDASCQFGGLGCFSLQCRYCKTRDTRQSSSFLACSPTTPATATTMTTTPATVTTATTTTATTTTVTTADVCWQFVSPGDAAAGLAAVLDASCQRGGLGCLSPQCRFCSVRVTPQSSSYLPCDKVASAPPTTALSSAPAPAVAAAVAAAPDPCTSLVSSGDVAAGITAVTQPSCGRVGGVGCVTATCRYCKTRATSQSAHLLDCSQLVSSPSSSRRLQDASTAPDAVVSSIDECSHAVSIEDNIMGIFGFTDARCGATGAPAGCFTASCRHCRAEDAALLHHDESLQALEVCARFVVASIIGDTSPIRQDPTAPISSDECAAGISFGGAQLGVSAVADLTCTAGSTDDHGCFARAPCRFCQYRATPLSAGLQTCAASTSDDEDDTFAPPPCSMLPAALALPANVSAVDEPRCNAEGATLRGCVAFTSCRACTTDSALAAALDLPQCDALVDDAGLVAVAARLAADTEAAHPPLAPSSWSPIILAVVGAACAVAAATIVVHRRRRDREGADGVRTSQSSDRVGVATLSRTRDIGADFFVL